MKLVMDVNHLKATHDSHGLYMAGSDKKRLLIIGKSRPPRSFKNVKIQSTTKAWKGKMAYPIDSKQLSSSTCCTKYRLHKVDFFPSNTKVYLCTSAYKLRH